jgi:hypothetical protein
MRTALAGFALIVLVAVVADPAVLDAQPLVAFATSVSGTGRLSTWANSGGQDGLLGADTVCKARAAAGGLPNPGNFIAWMSDQNDDAYCRIHGFSGKKSANCGQATLPAAAGPWVRSEGFPFSAGITAMLGDTGIVYTPPRFDEFGSERPDTRVWTGTDQFGSLVLPNGQLPCSNWISAASGQEAATGQISGTTRIWTYAGTSFCQFPQALLCMQKGSGPAVNIPATTGAIVFFDSVIREGDFGGVAAADLICQQRAAEGGLPSPSSFKAWLSDSAQNAIDRFAYNGRWVRLDGVPIAENKSDLTDGQLFAPINLAIDGFYYSVEAFFGSFTRGPVAWTATNGAGQGAADNCHNWTSRANTDLVERSAGVENSNVSWTRLDNGIGQPTMVSCFQRLGLYCFGQTPSVFPLQLFADGFESGSTSSWQ